VLTAEQATGGIVMKSPAGTLLGVSLDKSCANQFKKPEDACIEWKPAEPLPVGWWHGVAQSGYQHADGLGPKAVRQREAGFCL